MAFPMRSKKKPTGMAIEVAVGKPKDKAPSPFSGLFGKHADEETPEEDAGESPIIEKAEDKSMPKMGGSSVGDHQNVEFACPSCGAKLSVEPAQEATEEHQLMDAQE